MPIFTRRIGDGGGWSLQQRRAALSEGPALGRENAAAAHIPMPTRGRDRRTPSRRHTLRDYAEDVRGVLAALVTVVFPSWDCPWRHDCAGTGDRRARHRRVLPSICGVPSPAFPMTARV